MDSDPRARGNSSMLPRLPRPTETRALAHHRGIDVAGRLTPTAFISHKRPARGTATETKLVLHSPMLGRASFGPEARFNAECG